MSPWSRMAPGAHPGARVLYLLRSAGCSAIAARGREPPSGPRSQTRLVGTAVSGQARLEPFFGHDELARHSHRLLEPSQARPRSSAASLLKLGRLFDRANRSRQGWKIVKIDSLPHSPPRVGVIHRLQGRRQCRSKTCVPSPEDVGVPGAVRIGFKVSHRDHVVRAPLDRCIPSSVILRCICSSVNPSAVSGPQNLPSVISAASLQ